MTMNIKTSKYHVVWIPKYRRKFLYGTIKKLIVYALKEKSERMNVEIIECEIMPDHVHLFLSIPVTQSISKVVGQLKGYSSFFVRDNLDLRNHKAFWGRSYFCESVGHISEQTIVTYIQNQWVHYEE